MWWIHYAATAAMSPKLMARVLSNQRTRRTRADIGRWRPQRQEQNWWIWRQRQASHWTTVSQTSIEWSWNDQEQTTATKQKDMNQQTIRWIVPKEESAWKILSIKTLSQKQYQNSNGCRNMTKFAMTSGRVSGRRTLTTNLIKQELLRYCDEKNEVPFTLYIVNNRV